MIGKNSMTDTNRKDNMVIDRLLEVVEQSRKIRKHTGAEYIDWKEVCQIMGTEFPEEYNSKERWRSAYRKETSEIYNEQSAKANAKHNMLRKGVVTLENQLALFWKTKRTLPATCEQFNLTEDEVFSKVTQMRMVGRDVQLWLEDGTTFLQIFSKVKEGNKELERLYDGETFKIAILSDTHMGNKCFAREELTAFYEYAISQGITDFYHAGDIVDGYYKNRDDSIYEQYAVGFDNQLDDVVNTYPKYDGVTTYFITGNHDVTHVRNGGANIGRAIDIARDDLVYLGHNFAKVWLTENVDLNLIHPNDGSAYAVSLRAQKLVEAATGKRRAKIIAIGHYHKMDWIYWNGVHAFTMPSFEHQTGFMESKNLKSYVGGYILEIKVDRDGNLISLKPEFVELG